MITDFKWRKFWGQIGENGTLFRGGRVTQVHQLSFKTILNELQNICGKAASVEAQLFF